MDTSTISENTTLKKLQRNFPDSILEVYFDSANEPVALVKKEDIVPVLSLLKDDKELDYDVLMDVAGVDYLKYPVKKRERFEIVYQLYSVSNRKRVRIKCPIGLKDITIDTASGLWASADWGEREAYDQFGFIFKNHPNLKRILNHHEFIGHPLRKDYPMKKRQKLSTNDSLIDEMDKKLKEKGLK